MSLILNQLSTQKIEMPITKEQHHLIVTLMITISTKCF